MNNIESSKGEIVMYQPDETIRLEVRVENETVWLTQAQLVTLFQSSKANISEHITNIYDQGELKEEATVRKIRTVQLVGNSDRFARKTSVIKKAMCIFCTFHNLKDSKMEF